LATISTTQILENHFQSTGANLQRFVADFAQWKDAGSAGEDDFYEFGKDSAYVAPRVNGEKNILRHVHIVPILDENALKKWNRKWEQFGRRTSDRVLVYVNDGGDKFLLIAVLEEPDAHEIAEMKTQQHRERMELFAQIAEEFIYNGKVIA